MTKSRTQHNDEGFTLIEMIVSFVCITGIALAIGLVYTNSHRTQTNSERADHAVSLAEAVYSTAATTSYANLGYFNNDAGFTPGNVSLPLWMTASGDVVNDPGACGGGAKCPTKLVESQVNLGARGAATPPVFTPRVNTITHRNLAYRVETWVTSTADNAKRVTVQVEYPAGSGTCTAKGVRCVTQSYVRYPNSSDQAPDGTAAPAGCVSTTGQVCQTWVREGRVLSGSALRGEFDTPQQTETVQLYAKTTLPATGMSAQWTWKNTDGTVLKTVQVPVSAFKKVNNDPTRWQAEIAPDRDDQQFKGQIRPGTADITFTATGMSGGVKTKAQKATWTYASDKPVTAALEGPLGTCSAVGKGTSTRIRVTGLSLGYGASKSESSADTVKVTYTVKTASGIQTVTEDATVVPGTIDQNYVTSGGKVIDGAASASFTVSSPADISCPAVSKDATVTVNRVIDGTATPITLTLLNSTATGGGGSTAPPPVFQPANPTVTGARVPGTTQGRFTWAAVADVEFYVVQYKVGTNLLAETTTTDTSYLLNIGNGSTGTVNVYAVNSSGQSDTSTASVTLPTYDPLTLQNGWVNYGGGYTDVAISKSSAGVVFLKGLIKSGNTAAGTVLTTLPPGYRPSGRLIFAQATNGDNLRIDVAANGQVMIYNPVAGSAGWTNLTGIKFVAAGEVTMTNATLANGWTNYPSGYAPLQYGLDSMGRVHWQGLVNSGNIGQGVALASIPAALAPEAYLHVPVFHGSRGLSEMGISSDGLLNKIALSGWIPPNVMYQPGGNDSKWINASLQNGWVHYSSDFSRPAYLKDKDGVVMLHGLIRAGGIANGTVIMTLPPGYRPAETQIHAITTLTAYGRVDVLPNGNVVVREYVSNGWASLDSIAFVAEQ